MLSSRQFIGTLVASLFMLGACGAPEESSSQQPLPTQPEAPAPAELMDSDGVTSLTNPSPNIARLWGSAATNIWGVGASGLTLQWDGKVWRRLPNLTGNSLAALWGSSASDIWAVGAAGTVLHWNGTKWAKVATPAPASLDLTDVWGTSASDVWVVGESGTIIHYNGTSWTDASVPVLNNLMAVWASATNNAWAGGELGYLVHWDGTSWTESTSNGADTITAIRGLSTTKVWLTSSSRYVSQWNGTSWTLVSGMYGSSIALTSDHELLLFGSGTGMNYYNGTAWSTTAVNSSGTPQAAWNTGSSNAWAFTSYSEIYHYDGVGWSKSW